MPGLSSGKPRDFFNPSSSPCFVVGDALRRYFSSLEEKLKRSASPESFELFMRKITKSPLVSVIMPVYNAGDFLRESIESILNQTYKRIEFIIIDDASTDDSWKIIQEYKNRYPRKLKTIHLKKNLNKGGDAAANVAYKLARGKFVARMDADDISLPQRIETQVKFLMANPSISVVGSDAYVVNGNSEITGEKIVPKDHDKIYEEYFVFHPIINPSVMIRKSCLETKKELYRLDLGTNNDYLTFMWLISKGKVFANLQKKLICYRIHGENDSLRKVKRTFINMIITKYKVIKANGYRPTLNSILRLIAGGLMVIILPERLTFNLYLIARGIKKPSDYIPGFLSFNIFARLRKSIAPNEIVS